MNFYHEDWVGRLSKRVERLYYLCVIISVLIGGAFDLNRELAHGSWGPCPLGYVIIVSWGIALSGLTAEAIRSSYVYLSPKEKWTYWRVHDENATRLMPGRYWFTNGRDIVGIAMEMEISFTNDTSDYFPGMLHRAINRLIIERRAAHFHVEFLRVPTHEDVVKFYHWYRDLRAAWENDGEGDWLNYLRLTAVVQTPPFSQPGLPFRAATDPDRFFTVGLLKKK